MNFQWILLACFAAELIKGISAAITRPLLKNVLRLICIPVAFIITFALHALGVFQGVVVSMFSKTEIALILSELGESSKFINAMLSAMITPALFSLCFFILLAVFRMVHVPLVYKYIMSRKEKKAIRELRRQIRKEKQQELDLLVEAERKKAEGEEALTDVEQYYRDYSFTEDEIDLLVRERIAAEKAELKKAGFFKEGKKRFAMSLVCGAVGGFLVCSVTLMPFFHAMDFVTSATSVIENSEATDSIVYKALKTTEKHVVKPYKESFVVELYDSMALIDLMNATTRLGGRMVIGDQVLYTDDLTKDMISNTTTIAMELTTTHPNADKLRASLHGIINHPVLLDVFTDTLVTTLKDLPVPSEGEGEGDPISELYVGIILHYKNADKQMIIDDILAITDTFVVLAEKGVVMNLISQNMDADSILADKGIVGDLVASMSALSVFNPLVEGAFNIGMDMLIPNIGVPENNAGGYDFFTTQLVNSFGTVGAMTPEDIANVQAFMKSASEYESLYAYITSTSDKAKEFDKQVQEMKEKADELQAKADELRANPPSTYDPDELLAYDKQIKDFEEAANELTDQAKALETTAKELQEDLETKFEQIQPFINYFMAWMNVQKPFMLAGEDDSKACLSMVIDGVVYTCNTDEISIDDLLDVINKQGEESEDESEDLDPLDESDDKSISESIDEVLDDLPMKELLKKLKVSKGDSNLEGRVSPLSDLVNYLIQSAGLAINDNSSMSFDLNWLNSTLLAYSTNENISEASQVLVAKLLAVDGSEASKNAFDYKGVTVEIIKSSTHFGNEWTSENKKADSKIIGDIIFTFIDLKNNMGDNSGEGEGEGESQNPVGNLTGLFTVFGEAMDLMSDTTCLNEIPQLLIEGLLKGDRLGSSIPSAILQEIYPDDQDSEDFSYEEYMAGLSDRIDELMKLKDEGGVE